MAGSSIPRDPGPEEIARLRELLTGEEPPASAPYIAVPRSGQPYARGSTVPRLGVIAGGGVSSAEIVAKRPPTGAGSAGRHTISLAKGPPDGDEP